MYKLLLTTKDMKPSFPKWKVEGVLNPAAVRMKNNKIMLMARVAESAGQHHTSLLKCPVMSSKKEYKESYQTIKKKDIVHVGEWGEMYLKDGTCRMPHISHFKRIILDESGMNVEKIEQKPAFTGIPSDGDYGVEDPRITKIKNNYYMTYVAISANEGVSSYLAVSKDLKKWKRIGLIFREQNKDVVLFPEKIKNRYVAFNRPESLFTLSRPSIWISYSKDLIYWGRGKNLIRTRENSWEVTRNGAGTVPIKTKKGWLCIYHGVKRIEGKKNYSAGALLLDLKNPEKILARSPKNKPLFTPGKYGKSGFLDNVVFPTGAVIDTNKKDLLVYSGGADSVITVRKLSIKEIMDSMEYY